MDETTLETILAEHDARDGFHIIRTTDIQTITDRINAAANGHKNIMDAIRVHAATTCENMLMNELRSTALTLIAQAFAQLIGLDPEDDREPGYQSGDGTCSIAIELATRARLNAETQAADTSPDECERLAILSGLTLDQLDDQAQAIYANGSGYSTARQRYATALCHEINDLLNQ